MFPTSQVGNFTLPARSPMWEMSDVAGGDDLEGVRLYDAFMALKPAHLAETDWAEQAGVNRGFFGNLKTKAKNPRRDTVQKLLRFIGKTEADLRPAAPAGRAGARLPALEADQPPPKSVDAGETAPVLRLDLSYSMGPGTDLDGSYIDGEAFQFDLGFLRSMTITPADRLRIVDGIGDSMQPTLHDRDLIFVDVNQNTLNAQDRIWAIWLFGLGAVKRLRALDADKVLVISDNPDVENQVVNRVDITIHGRVVGSIKRH
jgi:phage repressor protein C with HTH and peptisase S24 domain